MPEAGFYHEILNTDSEMFGGSNMGNGGAVIVRAGRLQQPLPQPLDHAAAAGGGGVRIACIMRLVQSPSQTSRS